MCLAVPARIKEIEKNTALADFGGVARKISLGIIKDIKQGDYVLVHAGFAIGKVDAKEAADTLKAIRELKDAVADEYR